LLGLIGIYIAYMAIVKSPTWIQKLKASEAGVALHQLWYTGWGFDWVYDRLFVRPFVYLATINKNDVIDQLYTGLTRITEYLHMQFRKTQTGALRWYVMGIVIGVVVILAMLSITN